MNTGERWCPFDTNKREIEVNISRYLYALKFIKDKIVADVGCGNGLGTYLYGLMAKEVYGVDYSQEAIEYAKQYPNGDNVHFIQRDLVADPTLPNHEVLIAIEFLEHLDDPVAFLKAQTSKELVFSLPKDSFACSKWHKYDIKSQADVENLIVRAGYRINELHAQENLWFYGYAVKL